LLTVSIQKQLPEFDLQVQFEVSDNISVLFGPSGCGKTTILRCIAGLAKPDSGTIALDQEMLYDSKAEVFMPPRNREIGYVFQEYALFPHMDVAGNILYSVKNIDEQIQAKYTKLLRLLKIEKLVKRLPAELSGGEQQRIALARALMAQPKVLLLDEPLSALDNNIRSELQDELLKMQQIWRIPFILVTHDRKEADKLGDQIIFMDKGRRTN
jgi:ABC-type spermidine/putrescine transport systems, ATPase components